MSQTVPRRAERQDYRHFPSEYCAVVERFRRDGSVVMPRLTKREANTVQRELYRFFALLRTAPIDDEYAAELAAVADTMSCYRRYHPGSTTFVDLVWQLNPIVRTVRVMQQVDTNT